MGAGKTTIGRRLAVALELEFVDSDHEIETRTGASISLIFDIEGEAGFRRREKAMLDELTKRDGIVLATGGGAILDPDNRAILQARGTVVHLACGVEQQLDRTRHGRNRPLLETEDQRVRLEDLAAHRNPLYREVAALVVDTEGRSAKSVVLDLVRALNEIH